MNTTHERNKLKSLIGKHVYDAMKHHNLIIAGGAITSIFTNKEVNDIDVYVRSHEDAYNFMKEMIEDNGAWITSHTKKATAFSTKAGGTTIQLIHYREFESAEEIFKSFDFTINMGAYYVKYDEFLFHGDFFKHNAQKILKLNTETDYPIVSAFRIQKYKDRDYSISKAEYARLLLSLTQLKIESYDDVKEHLSGMYGYVFEELFEDVKDEEFDIQVVIDRLADIAYSDKYFELPTIPEIDVDDVLEDIDKSTRNCFTHRNKRYKVSSNGEIHQIKKNKSSDIEISLEEAIQFDKIYKFVKKSGSEENPEYSSFYSSSFKYPIGKTVLPESSVYSTWGSGQLFFNRKEEIAQSPYIDRTNAVLIEASFRTEDLIDIESGNSITVNRCYVEREVPKEEWVEWLSESEKDGVFK